MNLTERFIKYVGFDTQSDEDGKNRPSTQKQMIFAQFLYEELTKIGLEEVKLDKNGYLYATLPSNINKEVPTIGFISHMDTSPDCSGKDVRPRIIKGYKGGDIELSKDMVLSPTKFPELLHHIGEDIIVTDGHTLLGADDKAGVSEIIQAMIYLMEHPEIKHGKIRIAFTPDEEIGKGADLFDVESFGCQWAYTVDGGEVGELEYENFNAAYAKIHINGCSVHPGYAKGKMINAGNIATEIVQMLPQDERPETTEGYQGFYHLTSIKGGCEQADLSIIIRDHDSKKFENRKQVVTDIVNRINTKYGDNTAELDLKDQYYNMCEKVKPMMYVIDIAKNAMIKAGVTPQIKAIRGGTDGAQLSFRGLTCPNIFTGGLNFHGPYEYCVIQSMEKAQMTIVNICEEVANVNFK